MPQVFRGQIDNSLYWKFCYIGICYKEIWLLGLNNTLYLIFMISWPFKYYITQFGGEYLLKLCVLPGRKGVQTKKFKWLISTYSMNYILIVILRYKIWWSQWKGKKRYNAFHGRIKNLEKLFYVILEWPLRWFCTQNRDINGYSHLNQCIFNKKINSIFYIRNYVILVCQHFWANKF